MNHIRIDSLTLVVSLLLLVTTNQSFAQQSHQTNRLGHRMVRLKSPERYNQPELSALAFSTDSSLLAVAPQHENISFIRTSSGDTIGKIDANVGNVISMSFSKDDQRLLVIGTGGRKLFNVSLGTEISHRVNRIPGELGMEYELKNGKWTVTSIAKESAVAKNGKLKTGDEITGVGIGKSGPIQSVIGKGRRELKELLSGPAETYLRLEFIENGFQDKQTTEIQRRPVSTPIADRFRQNAKQLFDENKAWCISGDFHSFCNAATGQEVRCLRTEQIKNRTGNPALSPNAKLFAFLGNRLDGSGYAIEVFDIENGNRVQFIDNVKSHTPSGTMLRSTAFHDMKFSPDSKSLLVGCWDRICTFDIESGRPRQSFNLNPNLKSEDRIRKAGRGSVSLMDQATLQETGELDSRKSNSKRMVDTFALSNSNLLAVGVWHGEIDLWDFTSGKKLHEFENLPEESIETIEFSSDGRWLVFFVHGELHLCDVSSLSGQ